MCRLKHLRLFETEDDEGGTSIVFSHLDDYGQALSVDQIQEASELHGQADRGYLCIGCMSEWDFYSDAADHCQDVEDDDDSGIGAMSQGWAFGF